MTARSLDRPDQPGHRAYLTQDLASVNALSKFGLVGGVDVSTMAEPRIKAGRDPYFTDGLRGVLFIASEPAPITGRTLRLLGQ